VGDKADGAIGIASQVHRIAIRLIVIGTPVLQVLAAIGAGDMRGDRRVVAIALSSRKDLVDGDNNMKKWIVQPARGGAQGPRALLVRVNVGRRWKDVVTRAPNLATGDLTARVDQWSPTGVLMVRAMRTANVVLAAGFIVNGGLMGQVLATKVAVNGRGMAKKAAGTCGAKVNGHKARRQELKRGAVVAQMGPVRAKVLDVHIHRARRTPVPTSPRRGTLAMANPKTSRPPNQTGLFEPLSLAPGPVSLWSQPTTRDRVASNLANATRS
jgi:hypothetical protein